MSAKHEVHTPLNATIIKSISQLPWQQGFHDSKYYQILMLPQRTYVPGTV